MLELRSGGEASILLNDGRVLVFGGSAPSSGAPLKTAEVYNPAIDRFSFVGGSLSIGRVGPVVVKLTDGRILVAEGNTTNWTQLIEIYDPSTDRFDWAGNLPEGRTGSAAATLPDGRVLIAGGCYANWTVRGTAYLYDPVTQTSATAWMRSPRAWPTAIALPDGRVLLAGGVTAGPSNGYITATTEIFDPTTNSFADAGSMSSARTPAAILLPSGKVFLCGGTQPDGTLSNACDVFNPATNRVEGTYWMSVGRAPRLALTDDGRVLITSSGASAAEIFDPATGTFTSPPSMPSVNRAGGTSISLQDGRVLIVGGTLVGSGASATQAELFTRTNRAPTANAGSDRVLYAGAATQVSVALDGSTSTDPEGHSLTHNWTGPFGNASGASPTVILPLGIHAITLTVADEYNQTASATIHVAVVQGTDVVGYNQLQNQVNTLTAQAESLMASLQASDAILRSILPALDQILGAAQTITTVAQQEKDAINQALGNSP